MDTKLQGRLTDGPILKVLTRLALPIMASSMLSTAYNITDMAWIGKLGSKAVVGVGVGGMFIWLSQGLSSLARMGGQVYAAQCLGAGDREGARKYSHAAIVMAMLFGAAFGLISLVFAEQMVAFFGIADPESVVHAQNYLRITCGLIIFSYLNTVLTGLFTAHGDSKTPLMANFIGLIANMMLDPALIFGWGFFPRMEVIGAAVATVSAQVIVTVVMALRALRTKNGVNLLGGMRIFSLPEGRLLRDIVRIGGPTAVQNTVYCMISMVLTRMVTSFGDAAVATQRVGSQIESISWNSADGFAAALNAFVGQNFGARKMDRVRRGYSVAAAVMLAWGGVVLALFAIFPEPISRIFFHEAEVIPISVSYLRILGVCEPLLCVEIIATAAISGLGRTRVCSAISIIFTSMRIPLAYFLSRSALGLDGIWWAFTLTSMTKGVVLHFTFRRECAGHALKFAEERRA